jgi:hypothetical protein
MTNTAIKRTEHTGILTMTNTAIKRTEHTGILMMKIVYISFSNYLLYVYLINLNRFYK